VGQYTIGARVLDLFAGSGALGIEALSRRAKEAVFVDKSRSAVNAIRQNLMKLELNCKVHRAEALHFISTYKGEPFELVIVDPPYYEYFPQTILDTIEDSNLLNDGGHLVLEMETGAIEPQAKVLLPSSSRALSDTLVSIWFKKG
jgi:16S rRNA (guanine966-N2)-methyltransferase